MKLVITSDGPGRDSRVDPRFGRAKYLILFDTDTDETSSHDNVQNLSAPQGAGIQAAQTVARLGAQAIVTGNVGPKAFRTLQAAGIAVHLGASGTIDEALQQYREDRLPVAQGANVEGHWSDRGYEETL